MDLAIVIGGVDTSLSDGTLCTLEAHDGLGGAPLHRLRGRGPMQHGASDEGYRLDPRLFTLRFGVHGSSRSNLDTRRATLLSYLTPARDITLKFTTDAGDTRQIDCHAVEAPMPHDAQRHWEGLPVAVQFRAADPTFYFPTEQSQAFNIAVEGMTIPLPVTFDVGPDALDQTATITYAGSIRTYPRLKIEGPITDPVITRVLTGDKLDFTGISIGSGHYYEIDCRYGYKTVEDDGGTDRRYQLTDDSDLATFYLAPDAEVVGGTNAIRVTGSEVDANAEVTIYWYRRFDGVFG
jgi:hypothetical protein